ncbi:hypothetical protein AYI68_g2987 [Smittium mucronatum]|uniref:Uncharacterized protein n=1 Tax=Smittium mucronatum TaxID=133383 RepID=A0A1R0H172_9FUNG|nr:hypothetical protein AYI68_g2987 [Smittium mucronatum]
MLNKFLVFEVEIKSRFHAADSKFLSDMVKNEPKKSKMSVKDAIIKIKSKIGIDLKYGVVFKSLKMAKSVQFFDPGGGFKSMQAYISKVKDENKVGFFGKRKFRRLNKV